MAESFGDNRGTSGTTPPQRLGVIPRARAGFEGEVLPIEHHIRRLLDSGNNATINIYGPSGSGKTVALEHLAAIFRDEPVHFVDDMPLDEIVGDARARVIVFTSVQRCTQCSVALEMAPWGEDDLIEYLLAAHPHQCASVMARIRAATDREQLRGLPQLWAIVLDQFAADDSISQVRAALRRHVTRHFADPNDYVAAVQTSLDALLRASDEAETFSRIDGDRLLRHRAVAVLLASEKLAADISGERVESLKRQLPRDLARETAMLLKMRPEAMNFLAWRLRDDIALQAMAVSLLLAANVHWRPTGVRLRSLIGAHLAGAQWQGVDLIACDLSDADLHGADLCEARLHGATANGANLRLARLRSAQIGEFAAINADLSKADLSDTDAERANLANANLAGADLSGANLRHANLTDAGLSNARLVRADLGHASLQRAVMEGADCSRARFGDAHLVGVRLCDTELAGASFERATLLHCDLEGLHLKSANFVGASLGGSVLTGSRMPHACFRGASLRRAGLADVNWEGADLCNADLAGASFHMGSTRSGLIDSPIACEGSRTGFYTDDYEDLDFKSPEEIRKANLRGADLRGAKVDQTDFYLVDLRGALYTPQQAEHFRKCGAIL